MRTFSVTDIGKLRELNQDFIYTSEKRVGNLSDLFIVADGMGGHNAGDYASRFTVETMLEEIENSFEQDPEKIIDRSVQTANIRLREKASQDASLSGMGTTLVAATVMGRYLKVANVGDSRLYILNGNSIRQITRDHSLLEEMVRVGGMDRITARNSIDKNIITRAIGATEKIDIDFFQVELVPGDMVLMCTDGLTNMVTDKQIISVVNAQRDIVEKAQKLVETANNNGGKDNISVILIEPFVESTHLTEV